MDLPEEIWSYILQYIDDPVSYGNLCLSCKTFLVLCRKYIRVIHSNRPLFIDDENVLSSELTILHADLFTSFLGMVELVRRINYASYYIDNLEIENFHLLVNSMIFNVSGEELSIAEEMTGREEMTRREEMTDIYRKMSERVISICDKATNEEIIGFLGGYFKICKECPFSAIVQGKRYKFYTCIFYDLITILKPIFPYISIIDIESLENVLTTDHPYNKFISHKSSDDKLPFFEIDVKEIREIMPNLRYLYMNENVPVRLLGDTLGNSVNNHDIYYDISLIYRIVSVEDISLLIHILLKETDLHTTLSQKLSESFDIGEAPASFIEEITRRRPYRVIMKIPRSIVVLENKDFVNILDLDSNLLCRIELYKLANVIFYKDADNYDLYYPVDTSSNMLLETEIISFLESKYI